MLYTATVQPGTLELLKNLLQFPLLQPFALAGGTNLSLRLGHRISVDLDLFTNQAFSEQEIFEEILLHFAPVIKLDEARNTLSLLIKGVKVDLLAHQYPLVEPFFQEETIRFWSIEDVIAMKLGAVSSRGAKKDFWDLAELMNHFSLNQMLDFFVLKYPNSDIGYVIRSLTYFEDADPQEDPVSLKAVSWEQVKHRISSSVKSYIRF
ncbi:nucleotidyl transferase AbiEii/AbiGii toxin family protein [Larkinella sp.]|uniref:nucleotidyl transferase AbiEii/AbiGii toxin family protein n=1 Tax=Larkinella sp. TaxID=2034517 RepID=UPI003BAA8DA6